MGDSLGYIDDFIAAIDQAHDLDGIMHALRKQVVAFGFEKFTYWLMWDANGAPGSIWLTSYPEDWIGQYIDQKFGVDDITVRHSSSQLRPYIWGDIKQEYDLTKGQKILFGEAAAAGLRSGGSVPIHGPGAAKAMFSVANEDSEEDFQKLFLMRRHEIHLLATYAHEKIMSFGIQKPLKKKLDLTGREIEVLTWTARGKTRWEISQVLMVSEETIKKHLEHACKKLDAQNKTHATAIALVNRLILP